MVRFTSSIITILASASLVAALPSRASSSPLPSGQDLHTDGSLWVKQFKNLTADAFFDRSVEDAVKRNKRALTERQEDDASEPQCGNRQSDDLVGGNKNDVKSCARAFRSNLELRIRPSLAVPACKFGKAIISVSGTTEDSADESDSAFNIGTAVYAIIQDCEDDGEIIGEVSPEGNSKLRVKVQRNTETTLTVPIAAPTPLP